MPSGCRPTDHRVGWSAGRQRSGRPAATAAHRPAPSGPAPPVDRSASGDPAPRPARRATSTPAPGLGRSHSCAEPGPSRRPGRAVAPGFPASPRRRSAARSIAPASPPDAAAPMSAPGSAPALSTAAARLLRAAARAATVRPRRHGRHDRRNAPAAGRIPRRRQRRLDWRTPDPPVPAPAASSGTTHPAAPRATAFPPPSPVRGAACASYRIPRYRRPGTNRSTACDHQRRTRCDRHRARPSRRRTPPSAHARSAIAPARCPAPHPAAGDPGRRPACTAPMRRPDRPAGSMSVRSGRRSPAVPTPPCAPHTRSAPALRESARRSTLPRRAVRGKRPATPGCGRIRFESTTSDRDARRSPPCWRTPLAARGLRSLVRNSSHQCCQCSCRSVASRPSQSSIRVARSAHCFAPNRCTISAASRSSRSDCQLMPSAMISASVAAVTPRARRCAAARPSPRSSAPRSRGKSACNASTCRPN